MSERKIKPRGIIKWHPFAAINDPMSFQDEINAYNNLSEKPILSEEQIQEINYIMLDAYNNNLDIYVSYFKDNQIQNVTGKVLKINTVDLIVVLIKKTHFLKK